MDPYLDSQFAKLKSLDDSIKRHAQILKNLREQKQKVSANIYQSMTKKNLEKYGDHQTKKFAPKVKIVRKKKKDKERDALLFFQSIGATEPHIAVQKFLETQKAIPEQN